MYALRPRQVNFDQTWSTLQASIQKIVTLQNLDKRVWDDNFSDIYALCVAVPAPYSEELYTRTKECLESHVDKLYRETSSSTDSDLLAAYYDRWKVFYKGTTFIHNLFGYLNKQFIRSRRFREFGEMAYGAMPIDPVRSSMMEIGELALNIWKRGMIGPLESRLVGCIIHAIQLDRRDAVDTPPSQVVHGVVQSLVHVEEYRERDELELYRDVFERPFIKSSSEHYEQEASHLLTTLSTSEYMHKTLEIIEQEDMRARKFLHSSSFDKVKHMVQDVMVSAHRDTLHAMTREMVQEERTSDMQNMYTLLKPIGPTGLSVLVKDFEAHVKRLGLDCVQNINTTDNVPTQFVEGMLEVYTKFSDLVGSVFQGDQEFWGALDRALQAAVNFKDESRTCPKASEWVAKYTDFLLRKSAKGLTETEIETKLSMSIVIFRYIEDKDIFQKFYSRMLAQRLIHTASVSMDAEETMIKKLKNACGYEFTSKLQRMFTDVGLSKELTDKFLADLEKTDDEKLDLQMQIQVLQAGAWPLSSSNGPGVGSLGGGFAVPAEFQPSVRLFEAFYAKNYSGRKLAWLYNLANADVRLNYLDKAYTVTMTVPQLAVAICFQQHDTVTVNHIEEATQLNRDTLIKTLRPLIDCGLFKSQDTEVSTDTSLSLNLEFKAKRLKFKISTPVVPKQAEKETEHVTATVQQDRKYFMECTIVRIMKTRKLLKHNALIEEAIKQSCSRFTPDVNFIKKVIETLIEKQYLQRTEQHDEYSYLA